MPVRDHVGLPGSPCSFDNALRGISTGAKVFLFNRQPKAYVFYNIRVRLRLTVKRVLSIYLCTSAYIDTRENKLYDTCDYRLQPVTRQDGVLVSFPRESGTPANTAGWLI